MFNNHSDVTSDSIDIYKEELRDEVFCENDLRDLICVQFGLSEQTYVRLVECGIDIESLLYIKEDDMKEIFPTSMLGQRVMFRARVSQWQQQNRSPKIKLTFNIRPTRIVSPIPTQIQTPRNSMLIPTSPPRSSRATASPPSSFRIDDDKIPLSELLRMSVKGQGILKYYQENSKFSDEHRVCLINAIVDYYKDRSLAMPIGAIVRFTEEIGTLFPSEEKKFYYSARGRGQNPMGKLYDKAINARRKIRKTYQERTALTNVTTSVNNPPETSYENVVPTNEDLERKSWLSQNIKPWDDVEYMWKKTFTLRRAQIIKEENILEHWPLFKNPIGFKLIDIDFSELFPDKPSDMLTEWPHFRDSVLPYFEEKIKDPDSKELLEKLNHDISTDSRDCILILLLHAVIKPPLLSTKLLSQDNSNKKRKWKPSISDAQNATIMHCITKIDFQIKYEQLKLEASQAMKTVQPLLVVIGKELTNLDEFYVIFDCVTYNLPSFVKALDILFKVYCVMNIGFRVEAKYLYELIETYFFKIKNTSNPNIISLVNQLQHNKN